MNLAESFRVAWEAIVANKLRAMLTMLGIIIGVGSVIAIIAIGNGTSAAVTGEFEGLGATNFIIQASRGSDGPGPTRFVSPLHDDDVRRIKDALPELRAVFPAVQAPAQLKVGNKSDTGGQLQAFPSDATELFGIKIDTGRFYSADEESRGERVAVVGSYYTDNVFAGENPVGQQVFVNGKSYTVIGVLQKSTGIFSALSGGSADRVVYVPLNTYLRTAPRHDYFMLYGSAPDKGSLTPLMDSTKEVLQKAHPQSNFEIRSIQGLIDGLNKVLGIVTAVISAIAAISLLVGGIGIMNIMLVSVTERTREIGIRKAIGARRLDILIQFVIEAVMICLIGGMIGVLLAAVPLFIVGKLLHMAIPVTWSAVALALGFSMLVGLIFGVYPANKAARMDPIEALRYE